MSIRSKLSGNKSYIVAAGVVLVGIGGFLTGEATLVEAITGILAGLGIATIRAGISKAAK